MRNAIDLATAKTVLNTDQVFINEQGDRLTVRQFGKYKPGLTIEMENSFARTFREVRASTLNAPREYADPYTYTACRELTDGMNMDWNADNVEVIFGRYRMSRTGRPVFAITDPVRAKDVLIRADWGGSFSTTRGHSEESAGAEAAEYFHRAASNGGGTGYDYYIVPVDFTLGGPKRDVTGILRAASEKLKAKETEYEDRYKAFLDEMEKERKEEEECRGPVMDLVREYLETVKSVLSDIEFETDVEISPYSRRETVYWKAKDSDAHPHAKGYAPCNRQGIAQMEEAVNTLRESIAEREEYASRFAELSELAGHYNVKIGQETVFRNEICRKRGNRMEKEDTGDWEYLPETKQGYSEFVRSLQTHISVTEEREKQEKAFIAAEKARIERQEKEAQAKAKGCPSDFTFFHRETGATAQSVAIVINEKGIRRYNDSIELRNHNHRYHYSNEEEMIREAEGEQTWNQILEGEAVIAFTKDFTAAPLVFHALWMPDKLTEAQKEAINEYVMQYAQYYGVDSIDCEGRTAVQPFGWFSWVAVPLEDAVPYCEKCVAKRNRADIIREDRNEESPHFTDDKPCSDIAASVLLPNNAAGDAEPAKENIFGDDKPCSDLAASVLMPEKGGSPAGKETSGHEERKTPSDKRDSVCRDDPYDSI